MFTPPDRQPPGGWVVKLFETGGTVKSENFAEFLAAANNQLYANGFKMLTPEQLLARIPDATH